MNRLNYLEKQTATSLTKSQGEKSFAHKIVRNRGGDGEKVSNFHFNFVSFNLGNIHIPRNGSLKYRINQTLDGAVRATLLINSLEIKEHPKE